jgi:HlyD family secretion protein
MLMPKFTRKKLVVGLIIGLIVILGLWLLQRPKSTPPPTITVTQGNITESAEAVGYIKPQQSSTVKSQISGTVAEIYHREGEYVAKNTPLLKVQTAPEPSEYANVYQEVIRARADEKNANANYARFEQALRDKIITANYGEYITARNDYQTKKTQRELAEQKLALLDQGRAKVGDREIANIVTSSINGFILNRKVDIGDAVLSLSSAQAATELFTIADMHDLRFLGTVDEMDAAKITVGMTAKIKIGSLPNQQITGTVKRIALQSEKENNTKESSANTNSNNNSSPFSVGFEVEISDLQFPANLVLRSGYSATADVSIKTVKNVLQLPLRVIQFKNEKPYVLLPSNNPEKPQEQPVELGASDGVNTEIKTGLKIGAKVIDKPQTVSPSGP